MVLHIEIEVSLEKNSKKGVAERGRPGDLVLNIPNGA